MIATDAFSFERYGPREWDRCATYLFSLDLPLREVEIALRSKCMRWAANEASDPERPTVDDFKRFLAGTARPFRGLGMRSRAGRARA